MSSVEISRGMQVVARTDTHNPPIRIGTVLSVYQGQYGAWDKIFARVEWTYQRRYLTIQKGEKRRGTVQTKALVPACFICKSAAATVSLGPVPYCADCAALIQRMDAINA